MSDRVYSVYEINRELKYLVEESFPPVFVEGEVSNLNRHRSGHIYLTLKDPNAQLSCTIWKTYAERLPFEPENGMQIVAKGKLNVFEKAGRYQFSIFAVQPSGKGSLHQDFERLKEKLGAEGLFDPEHKKPLPRVPFSVGVVTSGTGAAIEDVVKVLGRRAPYVKIILHPVKVQGSGASREIAEAIRDLNEFGGVDVMIVGRGGGSLEDLWAFNEEIVARAVYESQIPVISAVGHEVDFSICDFAADFRAPTPSAAAELVAPEMTELLGDLEAAEKRLGERALALLERLRSSVQGAVNSYPFRRLETDIRLKQQVLDDLLSKAESRSKAVVKIARLKMDNTREKLSLLSHETALRRGYSIVFDAEGAVVTDAGRLGAGDEITVRLSRGSVDAEVRKTREGD